MSKTKEKLNRIVLDNNTIIYSKKSEREVKQIFEERRLSPYKTKRIEELEPK